MELNYDKSVEMVFVRPRSKGSQSNRRRWFRV